MWRGKNFIIIAVLAVVVLVGSIAGVALAADNEDRDTSPPEAQQVALLDRICEIYEENTGITIDPQQLKVAFAQARGEMWDEALDRRLAYLVEQGKITQEQADEYKEWWQSRPDVPIRPIRHSLCRRGGWCFGSGPRPNPVETNS